MPSTAFDDFFPVMRAVLGDRQVMGLWHYPDADLLAALRGIFALGRGPSGFAMDPPSVSSATGVTPEVVFGDAFALITYDACQLLIGGEDGAMSYRTRSLSVSDAGHRKRDLLLELGQRVYEIRDGGGSFFTTYQSFAQWAGVAEMEGTRGVVNPAFVKLEVKSGVQELTL